MILVDLSQVLISNILESLYIQKNKTFDADFIRHLVFNSIRTYNTKFKKEYGKIILVCDSPYSWRKDIFKQYKGNRNKKREDDTINWDEVFKIFEQIKKELMIHAPFRVISVPKCEADDIIAVLSKYISQTEPVIIISGDTDFYQLHTKNILQWRPVQKQLVCEENTEKFLAQFILEGDSGDGIPNVLSDDDTFVSEPKKRQKTLTTKKKELWLSDSNGAVNHPDFPPDSVAKYHRNKQLIDFNQIPNDIQNAIMEEYKKDSVISGSKNSLWKYFSEHGLRKLVESLDEF